MSDDVELGRFLELLKQDGWNCYEVQESTGSAWWKLSYVFAKSRRRIDVKVAHDVSSVLLHLSLGVHPVGSYRRALETYLMRLNGVVRLVRFAIDKPGDVVLQSEISRHAVSLAALRNSLDALRVQFNYYHREIELLATDRGLVEAWERLQARKEDQEIDVEILTSVDKRKPPRAVELP